MLTSAPRIARGPRDWFAGPFAWVAVPCLAAIAAFCAYSWSEWTSNPDLSHGVFAPVVFGLLLWEGTRNGPQRWLRPGFAPVLLASIAVLGSVLMFALGGLLAASLGWSHSAVSFALASALAGMLFAALMFAAGERVRAVPLNWMVLSALGLWVLAAPLPTGTYARITLALQGGVTESVLASLHILGIPARQSGNLIELANTTVGVEEACSGIRSLISCVYAGLFFAAWLVRTPGRRIALVLTAPVLAIVMNFARSLTLTLMANAGIDIGGFWHDATGFAILGITALVLGALAMALSPAGSPDPAPTVAESPRFNAASFTPFASGAVVIAALLSLFVLLKPSGTGAVEAGDVVEVSTLLPAQADGWQVSAPKDLYRFADILRTPHLAERTYTRIAEGRKPVQINAYVAYWPAGAASVSMVASHTPDACWPGSGWVLQPTEVTRTALEIGPDRRIPAGEHRVFRYGQMPQQVWFWHIYDGKPTEFIDPYSIPALVKLALRYGFRREGSQYFVRFSSNLTWEEIRDEPLVHDLFANLARIGLAP